MAGVKGKSGRKSNERPIRHALSQKLDETDPSTGRKRMINLVEALLTEAENGDLQAIREVFDRVEGKPTQAIIGGEDDGSHKVTFTWQK